MRRKINGIIAIGFALFVFISLILSGCDCNKYEINTTIKPKVLAKSTNNISIEYKLGPCLILDDLEDIKVAQKLYIDNNKEDLELDLYVLYADVNHRENSFYYSLVGNELTQTEPVDLEKLIKHSEEIPGFKWLIKDNAQIKDDGEISRKVEEKEKPNKIKRL